MAPGKIRFRNRNAPHDDAGGSFSPTIQEGDLTYVGGFRVPTSFSTGLGGTISSYYHEGFTLKYEPNDSNNLHFLSLGYDASAPQPPTDDARAIYTLFQMKVPTLSSGVVGSPLTYSNWPEADVGTLKVYHPHSTSGGYAAKRLIYYSDPDVLEPLGPHLTGRLNVKWIQGTGRLYQSYSFGYTQYEDSPHLMYCEIDHANPNTVPAYGPWGLNGIGYKANSGWIGWLPASLASASGGRRLVAGGGRYASAAGSGDVSMGVSGVALFENTFPTAPGYITDYAHLAGYYPTVQAPQVGSGRGQRPTGHIPPGRPDVNFLNTWGDGYITDYDFLSGGIIVDTGTVGGLLTIVRLSFGQSSYASSSTHSEYIRDYVFVYSLEDVAAVLAGTMQRYQLQPTAWWEIQFPQIDYTVFPYTADSGVAITSITSTNGLAIQTPANGAVVTTSAPHGLTDTGDPNVDGTCSIRGTDHPTQYDSCWTFLVLSSTTIRIWNTSLNSANWNGATATQGTLRRAQNAIPDLQEVRALDYDESTKRVWVSLAAFQTGKTPTMFENVYQLP